MAYEDPQTPEGYRIVGRNDWGEPIYEPIPTYVTERGDGRYQQPGAPSNTIGVTGYDADGNPIYGNPAAGTANDNPFSDAMSTQNANGGTYSPGDWLYGQNYESSEATKRWLEAKGQEGHSVLSDVGLQGFNQGKASAAQLAAGADRAAAWGAGAAQQGRSAAEQAQGLSNQANQLATGIGSSFGDQQTLDRWGRSTKGLEGFQASGAAQSAAGRLANFDAGQTDARLGNSYQSLQDYASQGPGPSAAQAQLKSAQDANVAGQMALARSGRGAGENAQAARTAAFASANIGQQTAGQMASLRASEEAAWRQQKLQALQGAGGVAGAIDSSQQARLGLQASALGAGAQAYGGQDQMNLAAQQAAAGQYGSQYGAQAGARQAAEQARSGYLGQSIGAQQGSAAQLNAANQQGLAGIGLGNQGYAQAGALGQQASQGYLDAVKAGIGTEAAYNQSWLGLGEGEANRRAQLTGIKMGGDTQASLANQQADMAGDSGVQGMLAMGLGALAAL
jgi:hypothetical protein